MSANRLGTRTLCLAVIFMLLLSFFPIMNFLPVAKADLNSAWQSDFIWLVTGSPSPDNAVRQILETLRFTYTTVDVTTHTVTLSDFVSGGQTKYYGVILQDLGSAGTYLDETEISVISDAVTNYDLDLIVVVPWKTSIRNLLGVGSVNSAVNPYETAWPVDFAADARCLSFSGSTAERDVAWNTLYSFTVSSATVLATYDDTTMERPFFSVREQAIGSLCFAVGLEMNLQPIAGLSGFMPAILLGIAFRDCVPSDRFMRPAFASMIVDDHSLQSLGFQESLLDILVDKNARAAFGFIPAYYASVYTDCVDHFKANTDYWEIIVHGNNHSPTELNTDYDTSIATIQESITRMDSLKATHGVNYEMVEVFPYEEYVQETFKALRDEYFLTSMSLYVYNGYSLYSTCRVFDFSNYDYPSMGREGWSDFTAGIRGAIRAIHLFHGPIVFYFHPTMSLGWLSNLIDFVNGLGDVTWKKPSEIVSEAYDARHDPAADTMSIVVSKVRYPSVTLDSTKYYYDLANSIPGEISLPLLSSSVDPLLESLTGTHQPAFNLTGWSFVGDTLNFQVLSKPGAVATASIFCAERGDPPTIEVNGSPVVGTYYSSSKLVVFNITCSSEVNTVLVNWTPLPPDTEAPTYSSLSVSTTVAGNPATFSSYWQDNRKLAGFIFSTNNTGSWVEDPQVDLTGMSGWANVVKTLNSTIGVEVQYRFRCVDTSDNWGDTGNQTLTTTISAPPQYSSIGYSTTGVSQLCMFSCLWTDDQALSSYRFASNATGTWLVDDWAPLTGAEALVNRSETLPSVEGTLVQFQWWCRDSQDQENTTGVQSFVTTSGDPLTFGKTTIGNIFDGIPFGYVESSRMQAPSDGTAIGVHWYYRAKYTAGPAKTLIYSDASGVPDVLLYESPEITITTDWTWVEFPVVYSLESGTYYWFTIFASVELECYYDLDYVDPTIEACMAWDWHYPTAKPTFSDPSYRHMSNATLSAYVTYYPEGINVAPLLAAIGNKIVDEGSLLDFAATAEDDGLPSGTLTYSLDDGVSGSVPAGASIGPVSGIFGWVPTEAQGPGVYTFDVVVSDGLLTDFETITVTVNEVKVSLTVASAYGSPNPAEGAHLYDPGDSVTASVSSPVVVGSFVWACTGWIGTGSVPATGSGTSVTFTITANSTLTWNWVSSAGSEARFDFGTLSSPVEAGYTRVTNETAYSASTGYGWSSTENLLMRDRGAPTSLRRDFVFGNLTDNVFNVDLPNGDYKIVVTMGDLGYVQGPMDVYAEGVLEIDDLTTPAGTFYEITFYVTVADGQLNLRVVNGLGAYYNWVINALTVEPGSAPPPPTEASFDFGAVGSAVEAGYVQVTPLTLYSSSLGYGWTSTSGLYSRDRGSPDDLRRDLVFSAIERTFNVDLANGEYLVLVTIGDQNFMHDQISVYAEGVLVIGDVTVRAGTFQAVYFRVTVADEQLNIGILDDGGADPNWVLNTLAIQVAPSLPSEGSFDFGSSSSPLEAGYTQVSSSTAYSASTGYGWSSTVGLTPRDRGAPDDLKRDLVFSPTEHTFNVDLANGDYAVTVTIGDQSYMHDNIDIYAEDVLKIDDLSAAKGSFQEVMFTVSVADGQLNLRIADDGGADPNWVLNALEIQAV